MNRYLTVAALGLAVLVTLAVQFGASAEANGRNLPTLELVGEGSTQLDTGRVIVQFAPAASAADQATLHARHGGRVIETISGLSMVVVQLPDAAATQAVAAAYAANPLVAFAEPDALRPLADASVTPDDQYYYLQWQHLPIYSPEAWATHTGSSEYLLTVCDTGVSASHPDLIANLRGDLGTNTAGGGDNWSPVHYHGTAVAGAAAAVGNNSIGVTGVAWDAGIVPVRVSDRRDGAAFTSDLVQCIEYGADIGSTAINLSYTTQSGGQIDPAIIAAGDYANAAGAVLVVAAGNSNTDASPGQDPANIVYVAATNSGNGKASFSNYGVSVDIAAPGESVASTYSEVSCRGRNCSVVLNDYAWVSGTSFASPIVAGAVIVAADAHAGPEMDARTPAQRAEFLRSALLGAACDLGTAGEDIYFGAGLLNVHDGAHGQSCSSPIPPPEVTSLVVSPTFATVNVGGTQEFTATALWSDGSMSNVTDPVTWTSTNDSVAVVDGNGLATGTGAGLAIISAWATIDGSSVTGAASLSVVEPAPPGSGVSVDSISYGGSGGRNGDKDLKITVALLDDLASPVEGAAVEIWLINETTGQLWIGSAPTGADGTVTFSLRSAPAGTYSTTVMSVDAAGLTWDGNTPTNSYTKN